jgi:hypothetical protein
MNDHNQRPEECSTKYLESIEKNQDFPDRDIFLKELSKRRSNRRDLKALRASRREKYMEYVQEMTAEQAQHSGDPRQMSGGKKK